ncbi:hypothetical protein FQZ97_1234460 [compost metagenome]
MNTNVSLSRNIHIIALPQGTCLNASLSEDQSLAMPSHPGAGGEPGGLDEPEPAGACGCDAMVFHLRPQSLAMAS